MNDEQLAGLDSRVGFQEMTAGRLMTYLAAVPEIVELLGDRQALWQVETVGSDDPNLVFIVHSPSGGVCVKQALPSTRLDDSTLPLPPERAAFEEAALTLQARLAPGRVPKVLHYDFAQFLIVMERLHPHVLLRAGLGDGETYPRFAEAIAEFLARTLFLTSDLGMAAGEKRERVAFFCGNLEPCQLIEELTFTEPYTEGVHNRWTSPQLDETVAAIRADDVLKRAVSALKLRFMTTPQALVHGSLDTGSIMVTADDTRVIDPSYAFFGPLGFDPGELIGSLLIAYFAAAGRAPDDAPRHEQEAWILATIEAVWDGFRDRFVRLWREDHAGSAYPKALFTGPGGVESLERAQAELLKRVLEDALRFAGAAIIRQTIGRKRAPEFLAIEDPERRARVERSALRLASELVKDAHYVDAIGEVTAVARQFRTDEADSG